MQQRYSDGISFPDSVQSESTFIFPPPIF